MLPVVPLVKHWSLPAVLAIIFAAWYYLYFLMSMNMAPVTQWSTLDIILLFGMWAIMMAGMMLPAALPVFHLIDKLNNQRKVRHVTHASSFYFVLGYLFAWLCYSFAITLLQWWLHHLNILSVMMKSSQLWFSCLLLITAGIYQWLPVKQRCLSHCRSPLGFLTSSWQEGIYGAINMGFSHGQYCLGCCWILMALLFVFGVMSLPWVFALTLLVIIEKLAPQGVLISKILGALFIMYAVYLLL